MRILASSRGTRPALPGASKSAPSQRAVAPKAAPNANGKTEAAAGAADVGVAPSSDATSSAQRRALAAAGLAASIIMVRREYRDLSSTWRSRFPVEALSAVLWARKRGPAFVHTSSLYRLDSKNSNSASPPPLPPLLLPPFNLDLLQAAPSAFAASPTSAYASELSALANGGKGLPELTASPADNVRILQRARGARSGPATSDELEVLRARVQALQQQQGERGVAPVPSLAAPAATAAAPAPAPAPAPSGGEQPSSPAAAAFSAANAVGIVAAGGLAGAWRLASTRAAAVEEAASEAETAAKAALSKLKSEVSLAFEAAEKEKEMRAATKAKANDAATEAARALRLQEAATVAAGAEAAAAAKALEAEKERARAARASATAALDARDAERAAKFASAAEAKELRAQLDDVIVNLAMERSSSAVVGERAVALEGKLGEARLGAAALAADVRTLRDEVVSAKDAAALAEAASSEASKIAKRQLTDMTYAKEAAAAKADEEGAARREAEAAARALASDVASLKSELVVARDAAAAAAAASSEASKIATRKENEATWAMEALSEKLGEESEARKLAEDAAARASAAADDARRRASAAAAAEDAARAEAAAVERRALAAASAAAVSDAELKKEKRESLSLREAMAVMKVRFRGERGERRRRRERERRTGPRTARELTFCLPSSNSY